MVLKKFLLFFILVIFTIAVKAQGYHYASFGIGVSVNYQRPYADLAEYDKTLSFSVSPHYNITPYLPVGLQFEMGRLSGGSITTNEYRKAYDNHYMAIGVRGDIMLGEVLEYSNSNFLYFIKDFYAGTGLGIIHNKMAFVQRTNLLPTGYPVGAYVYPGDDSSTNLVIPLRFGYEYKIYNQFDEPYMSINLAYTHNFTMGEGLDGYNDPPSKFKNNSPDQYAQLSISVKFNLFGSSYYNRMIH